MKKKLFALTLCLAVSVVLINCDKNDDPEPAPSTNTTDNVAPVLTLNGNAKDTVSLNSTYTDPGATATDNADGNITAAIVMAGNVNTSQTGDYTRTYNVKDAANNSASQLTRMVHVRNDAYFLAGNYSAVPNCGSTPSSNYSSNILVSATVNNQISISTIHNNYTGQPIVGTVSGTMVTLAGLNGNNFTFGGSGVIAANKKSISFSTSSGTSMGSAYCTTIFTKN